MSRAPVVALGIDVGTSNTKAVLVGVHDVAGGGDGVGAGHGVGAGGGSVEELAVAATPTPGDVTGLLDAVRLVVASVLDRSPARPDVVGVASMAETGVPLGPDGEPLTGLLRWDGRRAGEQAAALARSHGAAALFAATGVRPSAKVPLATWAWLRDAGVVMHRWAGAADLVVHALTGRLVTDHTLAGRTMAYRVSAPGGGVPDGFDADLLGLVGLGPDQLPDVVAPDAVAGHVDPRAATAAGLGGLLRDGLAPGTPVVVAGHDHAVGSWAAGVRRPGDRADSLGTAEAVLTVLPGPPDPAPVAAAGMSWVRTVAGRHHALLAGSSSAGAMLAWLASRLTGVSLPEVLDAAARDLVDRPEPTGLVVLPYLSGRQTPAPDPDATVRVVGHGGGTDAEPVRLTRAVLEGVCLQARWMLAEQARLGDVPDSRRLTVLGGPALSVAAWAETKRRVTPEPLTWVVSREPVAVGAAVLGAARAGLLGDVPAALDSAPTLPAHPSGPPESLDRETTSSTVHQPYDAMLADFVAAATSTGPATTPGGHP